MKKLFAVPLLFFVALIISLGCAKKQPEEIKIGAILPLTGDGAKYGEEAKNGIELALEELKDSKIKVFYEDDQGTSSGAVNAFNKLVASVKAPVIIGPMYSSTALAVAPLAEKNKVVILSPSASSPELTKAGDYFFRNWPHWFSTNEIRQLLYDVSFRVVMAEERGKRIVVVAQKKRRTSDAE